jgi:hypothetical protein
LILTETSLSHEPLAPPVRRPVGKRLLSTAAYVFLSVALLIVTPLAVFLPAALLHCGIRNGRRAAWAVLLLAAGIVLLLGMAAMQVPQTPQLAADAHDNLTSLLGLVLGIGLPSVLALPLIERGEGFGRVLVFALLVALGGVLATEVVMQLATSFSPYAAQAAAMREMGAKFVEIYTKAGVPPDGIRFLHKWTNLTIFVLPALSIIYAAVIFVISLVLLGRLPAWRQFAARRGLASPAGFLFRNLALPEWLLFGFVIGGLSPLVTGMAQRVGANVLAVVAFLYFLQGLSVFRYFVAPASGAFRLFAWGTLGVLTMTGFIGPLLLGIAGLFDSFFDFRHFNRKDHSDESHSH